LILVYIAVGVGEVVEASREGRSLWPIACTLGPLLLLWVLYCNLYPVPGFPNNLWPYVALGWMLFAWVVMRMRPKVCTAPAPSGFVPTHVTSAVAETPAES
jgi:hypothetical protein